MRLAVFLKELGSKKGAPGGGAAAALTGAAGAALIEMVARLNDSRQGAASKTVSRAAAARNRLLGLMTKDARAFGRIQKFYKLRHAKKAAWQKALKSGASVPLQMAEICAGAMALVRTEKSRTSRWLESDRREAAILLRAAFEAANLNVEVNLKEITKDGDVAWIRGKIKQWRRKFQRS